MLIVVNPICILKVFSVNFSRNPSPRVLSSVSIHNVLPLRPVISADQIPRKELEVYKRVAQAVQGNQLIRMRFHKLLIIVNCESYRQQTYARDERSNAIELVGKLTHIISIYVGRIRSITDKDPMFVRVLVRFLCKLAHPLWMVLTIYHFECQVHYHSL